jgi:hypothetical protein
MATRSREADVTGVLLIATGSGFVRQSAPAPSA